MPNKKQRPHFANKGLYSQSYGLSSSHVCMWMLDHKEDWALKNWCFWTVVLEKTLESPLDSKEIKPVNPKGNQPWIFIRTVTEAEAPIFQLPGAHSWFTGQDPDAGKDWGQEKKGATEDKMVGWHHWLNGLICDLQIILSICSFTILYIRVFYLKIAQRRHYIFKINTTDPWTTLELICIKLIANSMNPQFLCIHGFDEPWIMQYCSIYHWKVSSYKSTCPCCSKVNCNSTAFFKVNHWY